ncbi:MAG: VWA domain-containing protein [Hyphomicrobium sp.]
MLRRLPFLLGFAGALGIGLLAASAEAADAPPAAIVVFDGSGSIWGDLGAEKHSKFDLARDALKSVLSKSSPSARIGLMAFGHRRKGDCNDVELVVPPESGAAERLAGPIDKINPHGKGPLALAIRDAHRTLAAGDASRSGKSSVIVIHDGPDNCGQDICAIATELAKLKSGIAVHLIALGLERTDAQKMSCVPKLTGGRMFEAADAATLQRVMTEAFTLAALDKSTPAAPVPETAPAAEAPKPPAETEGPSRLRLSASLAPGGAAVAEPLKWRLFREGAPEATVLERTAPQVSEPIAAGKYIVEAHYGLVLTRGPVEVADKGLTEIVVPLDAGSIQLSAKAARTGDPLEDAFITVVRKPAADGAAATGSGEPVWSGRNDAELVLPAGAYAVVLDQHLVRTEQAITLTAGGRAVAEFTPALGMLELSAAAVEGGPALANVTYVLTEDDPDAVRGRREIARSAHPTPTFALPAGTYYVTARSDTAEVRQRIAVGPGDTVRKVIALGVARIEVAVAWPAGIPAGDPGITHRVVGLDQEQRIVGRATTPATVFDLGPGRYRIETTLADGNVRASQEIEVQPGRDAKVTQPLLAGRVKIATAGGSKDARAAGGAGAWVIRDAAGAVVWRTTRVEQRTATLAPGRYRLRSEHSGAADEQAFDLAAGDQLTLDPKLNGRAP